MFHCDEVCKRMHFHTAFVDRTSAASGKYAWWIMARSLLVSARCWKTRRDACTRLTPSGTLSRPIIGFGDRLDNPDRSSVPCAKQETAHQKTEQAVLADSVKDKRGTASTVSTIVICVFSR